MAAAAVAASDCDACRGQRFIDHPKMGRVRCPRCTTVERRQTRKDIERTNREFTARVRENLSPAEARRISHVLDQLVAQAIINAVPMGSLPSSLITTHRVLERWAAAPTGSPAENPDVYHRSRPPPLDPRTQEAVSDVVKAAPGGVREFVWDWYCREWITQEELAARRHMSRRQLGRERREVLQEIRGRFLASPHSDLVALVRVLPE